MTEPKLKPCPFCGCEAMTWKAFSTNDWRVFCTNSQSCGAMIRGGNTEQEIIEAWNKRVVQNDQTM